MSLFADFLLKSYSCFLNFFKSAFVANRVSSANQISGIKIVILFVVVNYILKYS